MRNRNYIEFTENDNEKSYIDDDESDAIFQKTDSIVIKKKQEVINVRYII